jgi:hypothetical protein
VGIGIRSIRRTSSETGQRFVCLRLALIVCAVLLIGSTAAQAAVTVGSPLTTDPNDSGSSQLTYVPLAITGGVLSAPTNGVVTFWRVRGHTQAADPATIQMRVLRPVGSNGFTAISTASAPLPTTAGIYTFPTRLPIQTGDRIGLSQPAGTPIWLYCECFGSGSTASFGGPFADGQTQTFGSPILDDQVMINADVEPDGDGDGFGDESQDSCATDATTQGPCPDKTAPSTALSGSDTQNFLKQKAVIVTASTSEAGTVTATGTISLPGASKVLKLQPASAGATANAKVTLKLKLSTKTLKTVRKALRNRKKVKATVTVVEKDAAGNLSPPVTKTLRAKKVKRPRR